MSGNDADEAKDELNRLIGARHYDLTSRGNAAILKGLMAAKLLGAEKVFVPDQGGWFSYLTYPGLLGLEVEKLYFCLVFFHQKIGEE